MWLWWHRNRIHGMQVGASNELPESEELDALYDRFLLRRSVSQVGCLVNACCRDLCSICDALDMLSLRGLRARTPLDKLMHASVSICSAYLSKSISSSCFLAIHWITAIDMVQRAVGKVCAVRTLRCLGSWCLTHGLLCRCLQHS